MKFPWNIYEELPLNRRNTLQAFITNTCNLTTECDACFARKIMAQGNAHMSTSEYNSMIKTFVRKGGQQVNMLGGEPMLHPRLEELLDINIEHNLKTTIYTNGYFLHRFTQEQLKGAKLRVSIYCETGRTKNAHKLPNTNLKFDANFMVSSTTTLQELLDTSKHIENNYNCNTFFISSIRELDNPRKEFFDDTKNSMPVIQYKELVHQFLYSYEGNMQIHISKRGVFESTKTLPDTTCRFVNYAIGGKIIQCPYDVVNLKYQSDYEFQKRNCQHNNTCLMSKIVLKKKT